MPVIGVVVLAGAVAEEEGGGVASVKREKERVGWMSMIVTVDYCDFLNQGAVGGWDRDTLWGVVVTTILP